MTARELAALTFDDGLGAGHMNDQASFSLRGRNPDVLTCIANLSNDEVFTPPEFANRMLDTLAEAWAANNSGADIWADSTVRFLDPFTKSGVFLREITSRLIKGLAAEIPDLQERVDHILTKQVFGIGITYLTSLLARRSLYCSKHANGPHSIAKGFASDAGNIWFERMEHTWVDGKCRFCGASQKTFDRGEGLETHAYAFIHTDDIKTRVAELFGGNMQFDVIIGNPPYQLDDGGFGTSAAPIYQLFVEQAKALEPRYLYYGYSLSLVCRRQRAGRIPRVDAHRQPNALNLTTIPSASDVFPGVGLKGGVCYFSGIGTILGHAESALISRTGPSRQALDRFLKRARTSSSGSMKALSILKKVVASRKCKGSQAHCCCLKTSDSIDWLVHESRSDFATYFKGKADQESR